jgi:hydrogenase expression/formation protein HypC
MCLSLPGTVLELKGPQALVEIAGSRRWCNALMLPELKVGDRVLVHAGLVLEVVDPDAARDMESLMLEMTELAEVAHGS